MANWCFCRLEISGDGEAIKRFKANARDEEEKEDLSLEKLHEIPEGVCGCFEWREEHWGTTFGTDSMLTNERKGFLEYHLLTRDAPPDVWVVRVAQDYPELNFTLVYEEECAGLFGKVTTQTFPTGGLVMESVED